jgi:hypothetical protein
MDPLQQDEVTQVMKQALSSVIHVSKGASGLQHLQLSPKNIRDETGRNAAALAVAAGLKAARVETQENEKVEFFTPSSPHNTPRTQPNTALASLIC